MIQHRLTVNKDIIEPIPLIIPSGNVETHELVFDFSADWDGLKKIAVFTRDGTVKEYTIDDAARTVPGDMLSEPGTLTVGVYGYIVDGEKLVKRLSTNIINLVVIKGAYASADPGEDVPPSAYEQLSSKVDDHIADKDNPHKVTASQVGAYSKAEIDTALAGKLDKVKSLVRVYPGVYATDDTDGTPHLITATSDLSYIGTSSGYIPLYEAGGQLKTATPTSDDSAANKGYVDESTDALKIHGKKIGSVVRIDDAFDAEYAKVSCTSSVKKYGKNLVPYPYAETTNTENGITFTDNGDGTVTANGTASKDANFLCSSLSSLNFKKGTYTLTSGIDNDNAGKAFGVVLGYKYPENTRNTINTTNGSCNFSLLQDAMCDVILVIRSGKTANNLVFKPQLELGGIGTSYEIYKPIVTYKPNTSGKVDIPLYSDTTTLMADGAIITANYTRNTTDVISKIEENSNPYELIETITLTEATQIIERSREPNGTAYGFSKVLITVDTPKTDTVAQQNIRLYINDGTLDYYAYYQSLTAYAKRAHFDCAVENGLLKIRIGNGATNYGGESTGMASMIENANIVFLSAINKIKLKGEATFAVGTIIKIYGVRA